MEDAKAQLRAYQTCKRAEPSEWGKLKKNVPFKRSSFNKKKSQQIFPQNQEIHPKAFKVGSSVLVAPTC